MYESVWRTVAGLAAGPTACLRVPPVAHIAFPADNVLPFLDFGASTAIHSGALASNCELTGPGLLNFAVGRAAAEGVVCQNVVTLVCRDVYGAVTNDVDARDVSLRILRADSLGLRGRGVVAGSVASPTTPSPGVFSWSYTVEDDDVTSVDVEATVYGQVVTGSPIRVHPVPHPFRGSLVLACVSPPTLQLFADGVRTWLSGAGKPALLFRMSRDGSSTSDFHLRCDGKGSTVTLIKSTNGWVFGGYAGAAWCVAPSGNFTHCARAFLFTVSNPHGIPPTRYPVRDPEYALQGRAAYGPVFGATALRVGAGDHTLCSVGETPFGHYTDTTGLGGRTFACVNDDASHSNPVIPWLVPARHPCEFTPAEIEVWQVPTPA